MVIEGDVKYKSSGTEWMPEVLEHWFLSRQSAINEM